MARKLFARRPTPVNKAFYNMRSRDARDCVTAAKRQSWEDFLSRLTPQTPMTVVWGMFRAVSGRPPRLTIPLSVNNSPLNSLDAAEALADHFAVSLSQVHHIPVALHDSLREALLSDGDPALNGLFTKQELLRGILRLSTRTAPGSDLVHNAFLCRLPSAHRESLLLLFNQSLEHGVIPLEWRTALVVPILKPGKDPSVAASYRPISLLSCVGKLMERLVHDRLQWFLERRACFLPHQFGFRRRLCSLHHGRADFL